MNEYCGSLNPWTLSGLYGHVYVCLIKKIIPYTHLKMLICLCAHSVAWVLNKSYITPCASKSNAWRMQSLMALPEPNAVQVDFVSIVSSSHLSPQESLLADVANCAKVYGCTKRWGQVLCLASDPARSTMLCFSGSFIHPVSNSSCSISLGFYWSHR